MVRFLLLGLFANASLPASAKPQTRKIGTAVAPLKTILQKLAGSEVQVISLVATGREPDSFDPTPKDLKSLSALQVYFSLGLPFEQAIQIRLKEISPVLQLTDLRKNISGRLRMSHLHGDESHELEDPHFWTNPLHVVSMCEVAHSKLSAIYPELKSEFDRNLLALTAELQDLNKFITEKLTLHLDREIWVFHAAWGYFAQQYQLRQVAVEAPNKERSPKQLASLVQRARKSKISTIFSQPQFSSAQPKFFADQFGAKLVLIDPLREDYFDNMRAIAEIFSQSLNQ
jgi:zinc transport system substrate-binding protein